MATDKGGQPGAKREDRGVGILSLKKQKTMTKQRVRRTGGDGTGRLFVSHR